MYKHARNEIIQDCLRKVPDAESKRCIEIKRALQSTDAEGEEIRSEHVDISEEKE